MTDPNQPNPYASSNPYSSTNPYESGNGPTAGKSPVLSIISFIMGILGVISGFFGIGLLFSIAAVVLGHMGKSKEPEAKGFWLTGLITGYVGVAINVIVLILIIVVGVAFFSSIPMWMDTMNYSTNA